MEPYRGEPLNTCGGLKVANLVGMVVLWSTGKKPFTNIQAILEEVSIEVMMCNMAV